MHITSHYTTHASRQQEERDSCLTQIPLLNQCQHFSNPSSLRGVLLSYVRFAVLLYMTEHCLVHAIIATPTDNCQLEAMQWCCVSCCTYELSEMWAFRRYYRIWNSLYINNIASCNRVCFLATLPIKKYTFNSKKIYFMKFKKVQLVTI